MTPLLTALFSLSFEGYMLSGDSTNLTVRSTAGCADVCLAETACYGFFFKKKSGLCQLNDSPSLTNKELTLNSDMRYYILNKDPYCPTEKGYRFSSDSRLCYKLVLQEVNHDDAMAVCQNDGGFLIRIDSQKKQDYVAQLHQEMPPHAEPWIDGGVDGKKKQSVDVRRRDFDDV